MTETEAPRPKLISGRRLARHPKAGWCRNPLMGLPRNMSCPCFSGKKFKVCCLPLTHEYIPGEALEAYRTTCADALQGVWCW